MESRSRPTTRPTDSCNPGVGGNSPGVISDLGPGRRCSLEAEADAEEDPELWDQDEDDAQEMADFEEAPAPGGPPVEPRQTRKAAAERAPPTPPQQKKTRTTELEALVRGSAPLSQVQVLTRAKNPRDTELGTLSQ